MRRKMMFRPAMVALSMTLSTMACAAATPKGEQGNISWFAEAGFGYDSNAFLAPRNTYIDYAAIPGGPLGPNPTIVPQTKSGFFVPYKAKVEAGKRHESGGGLVGSATVDGRLYASGLDNANEFNFAANGGSVFDLGKGGNSKKTAYVGAVYEHHLQVYVDHDSGASKTTTVSGTDISNRYNFSSAGLEGEFKHRMERIDYAIKAQYLMNDYTDPIVVSQLDHTYVFVGGDVDFLVSEGTKLNLSAARSTRDYTYRHARDASGVYSSANNPLLKYTYYDLGATLRNRVSPDWLFYLDYDYSHRTDSFVSYNDYNSHRYGGRLMYEQGALKGRLSLHRWNRDYPNAFAFDVAGQAGKVYSGYDLRFKAEYAQTKALSFWAEAIYTNQNSTDLRYDYYRKQVMAGVKWEQ